VVPEFLFPQTRKGLTAIFVALIKNMEHKDVGISQVWLMTLNALLDLGPKGEAAERKEIRAILDHGS